jgi:hypothetical protein
MLNKTIRCLKKDIAKLLAIIFKRYKKDEVSCHSIISQFDHYIVKARLRALIIHSLKIKDSVVEEIIEEENKKIVVICDKLIIFRRIIKDSDIVLYVGDVITTDIMLLSEGLSLNIEESDTKYIDIRERR